MSDNKNFTEMITNQIKAYKQTLNDNQQLVAIYSDGGNSFYINSLKNIDDSKLITITGKDDDLNDCFAISHINAFKVLFKVISAKQAQKFNPQMFFNLSD